MAQSIPLEEFDQYFGGGVTELSSEALGGYIVAVSDEWFAEAKCLLRPGPAQSLKGQFGPNGALFDGWESRRHCPTNDWVIIRLGAPSGTLIGFDIDTSNFNGNESPETAVFGICRPENIPVPTEDDSEWEQLLPVTPLGPSSRHLFKIPSSAKPYTHLKLLMIPDGGIARFRAYGTVVPVFPTDPFTSVDLASALMGGEVVFTSDQHFGVGGNLVLPGRGPASMDGGWETARSRKKGHSDHVVIKLGAPGYLDYTEIDTNYFIGNFPQQVDLYGTNSSSDIPGADVTWVEILPRAKLGPHRQHYYQLTKPNEVYTHVRMAIYPDGGVKRLRLIGHPAAGLSSAPSERMPLPVGEMLIDPALSLEPPTAPAVATSKSSAPRYPILPLTAEAFAPYGQVIQSYSDLRACPPSTIVKRVNIGTANKFNHLAPVTFVAPPHEKWMAGEKEGKVNFCVFSCEPQAGTVGMGGKETWMVKALERHEFSSQAFSPMGGGGERYLVVVALPGNDGKPDMSSLRAFFATSKQGISYHANIWHHPLIALDKHTDFACVVNETGDSAVDCEILQFSEPIAVLESTV